MNRNGWLAALALAALACSSGEDVSSMGPEAAGDVTVGNNVFTPATLNVDVGRTVTWIWDPGGVDHNVTFDDGSPGSATQSSGNFQRTFATAGSFAYHCTIHGAAVMHGVVNVGSGGGGGGGGGTGGGGGYD
jgi:plastocyanin